MDLDRHQFFIGRSRSGFWSVAYLPLWMTVNSKPTVFFFLFFFTLVLGRLTGA